VIKILPEKIIEIRSLFIFEIRRIFHKNNYIELETPLLNPGGNVEAFIDSFQILRTSNRKSPEDDGKNRGKYLITSPEYNLKTQLAHTGKNIFQIAHCFREGDVGSLHTEEFLMLEWYRQNCPLEDLMEECRTIFHSLSILPFSKIKFLPDDVQFYTVQDLFIKFTGCSLDYDNLLEYSINKKYIHSFSVANKPRYDEIFFVIFLNEIERYLGMDAPCFIYNYPDQLAALSRIENGFARRFEIYWKGIELANGYEELKGKEENLKRFRYENSLRTLQKKNKIPHEDQFLDSMDLLPDACGIALGLDRLLMVLLNESDIRSITPFL